MHSHLNVKFVKNACSFILLPPHHEACGGVMVEGEGAVAGGSAQMICNLRSRRG